MLNKYILSIDNSISIIMKKYKIMIMLNKQATITNESTVYNDNKQ